MKKAISAIAALSMLLSCANNSENKTVEEDPFDGPEVEMTTSLGAMKIRLFNATPQHRDNFLKLAKEGYYDGIRFHRVIDGFMIQGGDPLSKDEAMRDNWGTGGPGYTIAAEFVNGARHCKGALAAARLGDMANPRKASSGSQFYIVQSEDGCRHLDGEYTVYGQVTEGLEVIDAIASVQTDPYDRPLSDVIILKVQVIEPEPEAEPEVESAAVDEAQAEPAAEPEVKAEAQAESKKKSESKAKLGDAAKIKTRIEE